MGIFLLTIFTVGTLGFWIFAALSFALLLWLVAYEKPFSSAVCLIGIFCALASWGNFNLWHVAHQDPWAVARWAGIYVLSGIVWAVVWFWFVNRDRRNNFNDAREAFVAKHKLRLDPGDAIPAELRREFKAYLRNGRPDYMSRPIEKPVLADFRRQLLIRMAYWPVSIVLTMFDQPWKWFWRWVFRQLKGVFQKTIDVIWKGVDQDLEEPPTPPFSPPAVQKKPEEFNELLDDQ